MNDFKRTVAFRDGRQVTFNAAAPTKAQSLAGLMARYLLLGIGFSGCTIVWGASAYFNIDFAAGFFSLWWQKSLWGGVALALDIVKAAMPIVIFSSRARGEEENVSLATLALLVTASLSLAAGVAYLHDAIPVGGGNTAPLAAGIARIISLVMAFLLAIGMEIVAAFGFYIVLTGAKALQETYDETPVEEVPVTLEPAAGSFEQGFSVWASERLATDVRARLSSQGALQDYSRWAMFNGPYQVPKPESFGRTLAAHAEAMGASRTRSGGRAVYAGIGLSDAAQRISLPKSAK